MHRIKINIPVYDFKCNVIIDDNIDAVIDKYMKKHGMPRGTDECHGMAIVTPLKQYYIFYDLQSCTPNVISHEISHMVDYLLEEHDIEKVGESRAYLMGYMVEKVFDYILKKNLLISKYLNFAQKPAPMAEGSNAGLCKSLQP